MYEKSVHQIERTKWVNVGTHSDIHIKTKNLSLNLLHSCHVSFSRTNASWSVFCPLFPNDTPNFHHKYTTQTYNSAYKIGCACENWLKIVYVTSHRQQWWTMKRMVRSTLILQFRNITWRWHDVNRLCLSHQTFNLTRYNRIYLFYRDFIINLIKSLKHYRITLKHSNIQTVWSACRTMQNSTNINRSKYKQQTVSNTDWIALGLVWKCLNWSFDF